MLKGRMRQWWLRGKALQVMVGFVVGGKVVAQGWRLREKNDEYGCEKCGKSGVYKEWWFQAIVVQNLVMKRIVVKGFSNRRQGIS